jgi:hypothetical protein
MFEARYDFKLTFRSKRSEFFSPLLVDLISKKAFSISPPFSNFSLRPLAYLSLVSISTTQSSFSNDESPYSILNPVSSPTFSTNFFKSPASTGKQDNELSLSFKSGTSLNTSSFLYGCVPNASTAVSIALICGLTKTTGFSSNELIRCC